MKHFIEVEFYGSKGRFSGKIGRFRSIDSLQQAWQRYLDAGQPGQIRDDEGKVITGIWQPGYRILTRPPGETP